MPTAPPADEEASSVIWEAIHGKREKKILLADDDEGIRRIFKRILAHGVPSARVDEASNGREAIDAFHKEQYNIIIMDLRMPVMDGHEAFLRIKEMCEAENMKMPSVIFCTGYSPPGSIQKIVADDPSHALLLKPTTDICILNAVEQRL
jgi:CheY-like chemotaxis protein